MEKFKIVKLFLNGLVAIGIAGPVGVGSFILIENLTKYNPSGQTGDFESIAQKSKQWSNFFYNNSYKVQFTVRDSVLPDTNAYSIFGTCWSWYYGMNSNTNSFEWYLMTNFHVVNDICYELWNKQPENKNNEYGYLDKMVFDLPNINQDMSIYNWSSVQRRYTQISLNNLTDIDIIIDNKFSNTNYNQVLFSNPKDSSNRYALDMALIRLTFNYDYSQQLESKHIMNPFSLYKNDSKLQYSNRFGQTNKPTLIGGNPHKTNTSATNVSNTFVDLALESNWELSYNELNINSQVAIKALKNLKAPYMYTTENYNTNNWKLIGGSSGSPVFQNSTNTDFWGLTMNDIITKLLPTAIYWGARADDKFTSPSVIPLIYGDPSKPLLPSYNVFNNFDNCYKNGSLWEQTNNRNN